MSYGAEGLNGYTNGYNHGPAINDTNGPDRMVRRGGLDDLYAPHNITPGYGQDDPYNPDALQPYSARPVPEWRRQYSAERGARNDSISYFGDGPGARQIEGVVQHINEQWRVLTGKDCVPVHVALQLMDHSSLGRGNDYHDFQQTSKALQKGLRTIVNEHHQGFNSSIGTFHKIQASIHSSQERVRTLKSTLMGAKGGLAMTRPEVRGLAATSQNYDEMLQVIGQIEKLQALPELLDSQISDKRFLSAVDTLQEALRLIRSSILENIGALSDLRIYLDNQGASLAEILLEELHDHLYLKSAYAQQRWKSQAPTPKVSSNDMQNAQEVSTGIRPLYRFLTSLNTSAYLTEDTSRNPEDDSFEYMHITLEALNRMGRLEMAVDRMEQRLPIELFAVVEKTIQEVDARHPLHVRSAMGGSNGGLAFAVKWAASSGTASELILNDLLQTLFSKFEAIAEGHRAVHEIIAGITHREGVRKTEPLLGGFKELWKLYQSEMRSLLHDYLTTDTERSLAAARDASDGNRNIFQRQNRDRLKRLFKIGEMDKKAQILQVEEEELDKILQSSVPGLVNKSADSSQSTKLRKVASENAAAGHKLLVDPSVFNISTLLPPSLSFLQRLKEIVPPDSEIAVSTLTTFLDDFLVNVFNPQLDETVSELCAQCFIDTNAFQQDDHWANSAPMPIFRGATVFFSLIKAFCRMLENVPQDQAFTHLIVQQLRTYYDKCATWYHSLVMRATENGQQPKRAAAILEESELAPLVEQVWYAEDEEDRIRIMREEAGFVVEETRENPMDPSDLISDRRTGTSLCLLYTSLEWLAARVEELRSIVRKTRNSVADADQRQDSNQWAQVGSGGLRDRDRPVVLRMNDTTVVSFDRIVSGLRMLAQMALFTMHIDIRLGISFIVAGIMDAPYSLDSTATEAGPLVIRLNADLLSFDSAMSAHLPEREYRFMTLGLGILIDELIVTKVPRIKVMNQRGCELMQLNILVLQQNLKAIDPAISLERSARFFDYFRQGPSAVVERAKETGGKDMGLSLDELKMLLELWYAEDLQNPHREVAAQAKRALGEDMLQLTEYMWST